MAHGPMALFRKHQKTLMAFFGVALMVGFLIGGAARRADRLRSGSPENAVVVSMTGESLRESDLQNMRYARMNLRRFMTGVREAILLKGAQAPPHLIIPNTTAEGNLVQTSILTQKGEDLGIRVSDDTIIQTLEEYSQQTLAKGDFARILANTTRMTQGQFFDAMRRELVADHYMNLYLRSTKTPTPGEAWDYAQRFARRATFEVVPFAAEEYLAKAPEPSEAEIQAAFDAGKERNPNPQSPEPGFRRLKKVAVQYVKADMADFLQAAKAQITDEQVQEYYDQNKESYRNTGAAAAGTGLDALSPSGAANGIVPPLDATKPAAKASEATGVELPALPGSPESSGLPELPGSPEGSAAPVGDTPTQPLQDDPAETGEKINDAQPPAEAAPSDAAAEPPVAAEASTPPAAAESTSAPPAAAEASAPTADSPAAGESDLPNLDAASTTTATPADENPLENLPDVAGGNAATGPEFKPVAEVADSIRTKLAAQAARQAMNAALDSLRGPMKAYYQSYLIWDRSPDKAKTQQPAPPDLQALAGGHGLTVGSIPLVDLLQMYETDPATGLPVYDIAMAYDQVASTRVVMFGDRVFDDRLGVYQAREIFGRNLDVEYLYWKTAEEPERVPELTDVRDEVVRSLKLKHAIGAAKEAAKQAAETIRQAGQRPSDIYRNDTNRTVLKDDSLPRILSGAVYGAPRISQIPGVKFPSEELFQTIYQLQAGEVATGVDAPQAHAYAIFMVSVDGDPAQIRDRFYRTGITRDIVELASQANSNQLVRWYQSVEKQLGLTWHRPPRNEEVATQ